MLELFGPHIERGLGFDLSVDMLAFARARLDRAGLRHCSVRQGDIYDLALPNDSFDAVLIHQVLHFLDDGARAIVEAARVLRPGGRLLVVDFAPHARGEENKRRLSLSDARANALKLDWSAYAPAAPRVLGTEVITDYSLSELREFIDWSPFFATWELVGKYPAILDDAKFGEAARSVFADAQSMTRKT